MDATAPPRPLVERRKTHPANAVRALVAVFFVFIIAGCLVVQWYLPMTMRMAAIDSVRQSNLETIEQIKLMRSYYTQAVVARALQTQALRPGMNYRDDPGEIPLPATLVQDLSALMSQRNTSLTLTSPYPWPARANRPFDEFERAAWERFQTEPDAVMTQQDVLGGRRVLRVAVADRMTSQACVDCHNAEPQSAKRDWKLGDVRAVFQVTKLIEPYLQAAEARSRYFQLAAGVATVVSCAALAFFGLMLERRSREVRIADENAYFLAEHDTLTGLCNRAKLVAQLDAAFADGAGSPHFALLLIDLDRFKPVNDTYGHEAGDRVLTVVAERLRLQAGRRDIVARLGGDEFALIKFGPISSDALHVFGHAICMALGEPIGLGDNEVAIGATIGVARGRSDAETTPDLLLAADLALYSAKSNGRARCELFRPELIGAMQRKRQMELNLRMALELDQFELHFQQIGSLRTGKVEWYEALLRWNRGAEGYVSPGEFIPLAEETGLIVPIGEWVLMTACRAAMEAGGNFCVAVNVSPKQLKHGSLLALIARALSETRLLPSRLKIEITESSTMDNDESTRAALQSIRALGVSVAIDDFGTGYSCLSYLKDYPVDCIKIDRSFVRDIDSDESARQIVAAVISLAKACGLETVAEGIETREQLTALMRMDCDYVQGFLFGRPKSLAAVIETRKAA